MCYFIQYHTKSYYDAYHTRDAALVKKKVPQCEEKPGLLSARRHARLRFLVDPGSAAGDNQLGFGPGAGGERMTRAVLPYLCLAAAPAAVCLTAGALLGFPLQGAVLGLGIGAGLVAAWRLAQVERVRDLRPVILAAGGAFGAVSMALSFGVLHPPQLASAAVFGWGAGVAAAVCFAVYGPGWKWRVALAALAAALVVYVFHAMSLVLLWSSLALCTGAAALLLALFIELAHDFLSPQDRLRSLGFAALSGAAVGLVFGLAGQWWYELGAMFAWRAVSNEWVKAIVVGVMIGALAAVFLRLSEIVAEKRTRGWHMPAYFVGVSVACGLLVAVLARGGYAVSVLPDTFLDDIALGILFSGMILAVSHVVRRRARPTLAKAAAVCVIWFSLGALWGGPWPLATAGLMGPTAARSLLSMIPWRTSLGDAEASRPQLVHFTSKRPGFRSTRWQRAFTVPENASLLTRFRCVKLTLNCEWEIQKRLGVYRPCVVFLTPDGREIDRFTGGCGGPSCGGLGEAATRALQGKGTFLYWQERLAREPENPEALKNVATGLMRRGKRKDSAEHWQKLAAIGDEANPYRDEARFRVVQFRHWEARTTEDYERLVPEARELADTVEGEWRDQSLVYLAGCLERLERTGESIQTWEELAETAQAEHLGRYGRRQVEALRARKHLAPGNAAPDFSAVTIEGEELSLGQFRGSVVVLVFGHVWGLERSGGGGQYVRQRLPDEGAIVIDVVWTPSRERVARVVRRKELVGKVVPDVPREEEKGLFDLYGVEDGAMYLYVVDRQGTVAARGHGYRLAEIVRAAESLLDREHPAE